MSDSSSASSKEILDDFKDLGLSRTQAKTYTTLLGLGPCKASQIEKKSGLRREDVYRTLHVLKSLGIVEVIMNNPFIFVAVEPKLAINILLHQLESRLDTTRQKAVNLCDTLQAIHKTDRAKAYYDTQQSVFKLEGGSQIFQQMSRLVSSCKTELLRAISLTGISLNYDYGIVEREQEILRNGAKVRVITEISTGTHNLGLIEKYSRLAEVRHLDGIDSALKFVIADSTEIIFFTTNPNRNVRELAAIWTNNKHLIQGFRLDFEKSWKSSIPAEAMLKVHERQDTMPVGGEMSHSP